MSQYDNLKLENQLCFALYAATNAITRSYRSRLSHVGLTYSQYLVMMVLWQEDGITVKDIARTLQLDSATITPLLKRLESAGFITRARSQDDERVVNVALTDKGRNIQAQVAEMQKGVACQTQLGDTEFNALKATLHALANTLNAQDPLADQDAA